MLGEGVATAEELGEVDRVLGRVEGCLPGPTLLAVAGLHGNEPAGIRALRRVVSALEGRAASVRGEFVALAGNRRALGEGRRYVDHDLNRAWRAEEGVRAEEEETSHRDATSSVRRPALPASEDLEQSELQEALEEAIARARGPVFFLDLHTFSGPGKPFSTIMDSLAGRRFALSLPIPLVVGLGEMVEGTLLGHLADRGIPGVVFEGGQHRDEEAVAMSAAGIWLALAGVGVLSESETQELEVSRKLLMGATQDLPPVMELNHRHPVEEGDGFRMYPGYRSFQPVTAGQILAEDRRGTIQAPESGLLLMPLYQTQGEDGFFLVREFHPFWLNVSEVLRRLGAARILHWMPGIRRDPRSPDRLRVDKRLARWFTLEVLHLLGFRRTREEGQWLVVIKQREPDQTP